MKKIIFVLGVLAACCMNMALAQQVVPADSAKSYIGQSVTVAGTVVQVNKTDKIIYMNFEESYPNHVFTGVIFAGSFDKFNEVEQYEGQQVQLTGVVKEYRGKPQIVLENPAQIKIVQE